MTSPSNDPEAAAPAAPEAPPERREPTGAGRLAVIGVFALIVGLLLQRSVGKQDDSDWNAVVKIVLEGLPLLLIAAAVIVLVAAAALASKRPEPRP